MPDCIVYYCDYRKAGKERRPVRKEGDEGYDPYDFEEDEDTVDEGKKKIYMKCLICAD